MIALPPQLFYGSQISVCLWFLARTKANGKFSSSTVSGRRCSSTPASSVIWRTARIVSFPKLTSIALPKRIMPARRERCWEI